MTKNTKLWFTNSVCSERLQRYSWGDNKVISSAGSWKYFSSYTWIRRGGATFSWSIEQEGRPESGPSTIRWVKIFTWRANGDGIGLGKHTLLEGDFYIHLYTYSVQGDNHRLTGWSNQCNQVLAKPKSNILRLTVQTFFFKHFSSDSFIRTQDDSSYPGGRGIRRCWLLKSVKTIITKFPSCAFNEMSSCWFPPGLCIGTMPMAQRLFWRR